MQMFVSQPGCGSWWSCHQQLLENIFVAMVSFLGAYILFKLQGRSDRRKVRAEVLEKIGDRLNAVGGILRSNAPISRDTADGLSALVLADFVGLQSVVNVEDLGRLVHLYVRIVQAAHAGEFMNDCGNRDQVARDAWIEDARLVAVSLKAKATRMKMR
jgi:hypothetical protein